MTQPSVCTPSCKDGKVVGIEKCDAGKEDGCLEDCSGSKPEFECSRGNSSSPTVCSLLENEEANYLGNVSSSFRIAGSAASVILNAF